MDEATAPVWPDACPPAAHVRETIDRDGLCAAPGPYTPAELAAFRDAADALLAIAPGTARRAARGLHAARGLLVHARELCRAVLAPELARWIEAVLGPGAQAVRGILFDKPLAANWAVAWHQDRVIAVRDRADLPGYGPWSRKDDHWQVTPPVEVLEGLLTVRVHLDDCAANQGALRVVPGSHRLGLVPAERCAPEVALRPVWTCALPVGGVLLMRPLVLHASSRAAIPCRRRVVHLELAPASALAGLTWHEGPMNVRPDA